MHCASEVHLKAARRVIRYIKGTINFGIQFKKSKDFKLLGFSDSDSAGWINDMKNTSGYCFSLGFRFKKARNSSWYESPKFVSITQSTAEAEFIAATAAINQALKKIKIFVDNQAAIAISHNPVFHEKTKHFNIKLFFLREVQKDGVEVLFYEDGEPIIDGESGDLRFRIRTAPHDLFRREGNDLHTTVTITLVQALVGFEKTIKHLDEHMVDISSKVITNPKQVRKFKGEGMPRHMSTKKGDLYVTFEVLFPTSLTEEQKTNIIAILN
ncbi:DnaJ protein ERDJ3B, partial [Mucuna pruriens]